MPQLIVLVLSVILLGLILNPIALINGYFIFRPLVHPFSLEQIKLFYLPINWPFTAVILLGVMLAMINRRGFRFFPENLSPLYMLTFLSLLSLAYSINFTATISQIIKLLSTVSIVLLVSNVATSKENILKIYRGIALSSVIPMLYGYYQFYTVSGHIVLGEHTQRITSFFGFANLYGIFLALIIFCTAILYFEPGKKYWKRTYAIILISAVVSSILALNRGSWIAITLGIICALPYYRRYLNIRYFIIVFSIIGIAATGIIIKRFLELEDPQRFGENTFEARLHMWLLIINFSPNIPLLGYGAGTALEVLEKFFDISLVPHNDYLRFLIEIGFMGPIVYVFLLFREFTCSLRRRQSSDSWHVNYFTTAMIIYWVTISFTQNISHDVVIFPIFFVLCRLARQYDNYKSK